MQTSQPPGSDPEVQRLHRMRSSIEAINARIVRLAIALDVSLQNDSEIVQAMSRQQAPGAPRKRQVTADLLKAHKLEELRGLLVLRYGVETRYVGQVGVTATRQILIEAEERMVRKGFNPGDDGVDLDRMYHAF
ncbi:hypothetical protein [Herminiimonas sp. CN]|uniref:hypothetical protein n=1 Tax=Herminiimonas sp. CN TaxID=1349818 RepID=UPI000473EDB3|nr:hypothetical protein [Herminiimonas sp. CN]